jgi:hypothetical protein
MSKMNYSQIGWLHVSCDQLAGERDAEQLRRKALKIAKARPDWVKPATLEKFLNFANRRVDRIKERS